MMDSELFMYARLGFEHIADLKGYDHIVFITGLCALYTAADWRRLLWLVTAFTLGHSVTLALSTLNVILLPSAWVEFLIPLTIVLTCIQNIVTVQRGGEAAFQHHKRQEQRSYLLAAVFGLIHGLGFSTYLKSLLGANERIVTQLLAFNIGLELGQLLIVAVVLVLTWCMLRLLGQPRRDWSLVLSSAAAGIALVLMLERLPW
jgi:hypothetical protein